MGRSGGRWVRSWVEGFEDGPQGLERSEELLVHRVVDRAVLVPGLVTSRRHGEVAEVVTIEVAVALEREQCHTPRHRAVGVDRRQHGTIEDVGQDLTPGRGAGGTADEGD